MAATSYALPRTPQAAPPNFYSQQAQMGQSGNAAGGQGQPGAAAGAGAQDSPADHEFVVNLAKLLTVLDKMGQSNPNGVNIKKYTDAAARIMKDCSTAVTSGEQTPDTSSSGGASSQPPLTGAGSAPADAGSDAGGAAPAAAIAR